MDDQTPGKGMAYTALYTQPCPVCSKRVEVSRYWDGVDKSFGHTYRCHRCGTVFETGKEYGKPFRRKKVYHKFLCFEWVSWEEY